MEDKSVKKCEYCGKEFKRTYESSVGEWNGRRFCSVICRNRHISSKKKKMGYWVDHDGYAITDVMVDGKRTHVRVHRAVMESYLGRKLLPTEIVHHKDHNKMNNSIDNLELLGSHREHKLLRHPKPWNKGKFVSR